MNNIITSYDQDTDVLTIQYVTIQDKEYVNEFKKLIYHKNDEPTMHFTYHKNCYWATAIRITNPLNWKMKNEYTNDSIMDMVWNFPVSSDLLEAFKFWLIKAKVFQ